MAILGSPQHLTPCQFPGPFPGHFISSSYSLATLLVSGHLSDLVSVLGPLPSLLPHLEHCPIAHGLLFCAFQALVKNPFLR